jgi:hypothetical protein
MNPDIRRRHHKEQIRSNLVEAMARDDCLVPFWYVRLCANSCTTGTSTSPEVADYVVGSTRTDE